MGRQTIWDGDGLPEKGDRVLAHMASSNSWREYEVTGVKVSPFQSHPRHWRIEVKLVDPVDRNLSNSRLLDDIKPLTWRGDK